MYYLPSTPQAPLPASRIYPSAQIRTRGTNLRRNWWLREPDWAELLFPRSNLVSRETVIYFLLNICAWPSDDHSMPTNFFSKQFLLEIGLSNFLSTYFVSFDQKFALNWLKKKNVAHLIVEDYISARTNWHASFDFLQRVDRCTFYVNYRSI